jgi:hypothetical protein
MMAGNHPDDPGLNELIGELSVKSELFRKLWADHEVRDKTHGRKVLHHPLVGRLALDYESLRLPDSDQVLITYTAEPGSESETSLRLLASWQARPATQAAQAGQVDQMDQVVGPSGPPVRPS